MIICKTFDGGALMYLLKTTPFSTFQHYAENILIQYICAKLNNLYHAKIV